MEIKRKTDNATTRRRQFLQLASGAAFSTTLAGCTGDGNESSSKTVTPIQYPTKEVQITVPFTTGGGFDTYARLSKPYWKKHLPDDPTVTVSNISGGGGVVGAGETYNAEPDGHTFMIWDSVQSVTQQIGRDVSYDITKMSHIGALTQAPSCLISTKSSGIKNWNDLVNNIDDISFATQGIGSGGHIEAILLGELTGAWSVDEINFVHYDGTGQVLGGLEKGEAEVFVLSDATPGLKVIKALDAEMTILFSEEVGEDSVYYGVPQQYSANLDVKNIDKYAELTVFRRFFTGPPDVSEEILDIQRDAFLELIEDEDFLQKCKKKNYPIVNPGSAEELQDVLRNQFETFNSDPLKDIVQSAFKS